MTSVNAAASAADPAAEGYWTIEVIRRDRQEGGKRFVCHARDAAEARTLAGHLSGADIGSVGYDYHRIDNPAGRYARDLELGQSEQVQDSEVWGVLASARRSA